MCYFRITMSNFKIHYLIYAVVIGLSVGWLASTIASAMIVEPKALPTVKRATNVQKTPIDQVAKSVIDSNIFSLDLAANQVAPSTPTDNTSTEDSTTVAPPPPFTAKLVGIFQLQNEESGFAIISLDNGTVVLKTGEEKNNLKLISLQPYSALVERDGKKYSLMLEDAGNKVATNNTSTAKPTTPSTPATTTGSNINLSLQRNDVKSELQDLNKVLQSALVSPFYSNGEYLGYRVTKMKQESPLAKLGLTQGDIITRINGSELKSPEPLFAMLGQIDDISAVSIDIIRNNEKKSIFVDIN